MGPCLAASSFRERWGAPLSWWRFPMMGSLLGPGGSFADEKAPNNLRTVYKKRREVKKRIREGN